MNKYKVTAKVGYAGHKEGDEFEADLTPDQERRATERGAIKKVAKSKTKKEEGTDA